MATRCLAREPDITGPAIPLATRAYNSTQRPSRHRLQLGVGQHQPFAADAGEVHLHARRTALAFVMGNHAFAEGGMHAVLAELQTAGRRFGQHTLFCAGRRPADMGTRPHLLQQLRGNLAQEPRRARITFGAVQPPAFGVGEIELALGAGDADVAQTPFLLEPPRLLDRHLMREQALFDAADAHQRKLEPFGGVQRHQLHAVFPLAGLALARLQRGVGQKRGERIEFAVFLDLELARRRHQLFEIFDARLAGLALFLAVMIEQAAVLDHVIGLLAQFQRGGLAAAPFDELDERLARRHGACRQRRRSEFGDAGLEQRNLPRPRPVAHRGHGAVADAAGRRVHYAFERGVVVAVGNEAQVTERVLDFGALGGAQAPEEAIGHADRQQRFFEHPRLRVRTIKYRRLTAALAGFRPALDALDDEARLVEFVERGVEQDRFALLAAGPQFLAEPAAVVSDQRIRRFEDGAGRAVILFETQETRAGEIFAVALDVFDARAAPAVDRLIVVADREQAGTVAREQPQPGVLQPIGVLKLVDQDVLKALAVMGENLGAVAQQFMGAQQ